VRITFITGGAPHYEAGLITGLVEHNITVDVIGGDDLANTPVLHHPQVCFRNIYGKSGQGTALWQKVLRLIAVYFKLLTHAAKSDARLIHIQWPYKFVFFERTVLNLYYKALRKKIVFTAHNVDAAARDGKQSWANRASLRFHYRIMDRIIVHTERMKSELSRSFGIPDSKISVIPHGVMSAVPESDLTKDGARERLRLAKESRVILAFGLISPYKGLEYLVAALAQLHKEDKKFILVIAGRIKECQDYWDGVKALIEREGLAGNVLTHIEHIPDGSVENYFKAADVLVMPYRSIFQSGVLFLAFRFGLPVIATDVGSLKKDVIDGKAGFISKVDDSTDLARTIETFFASDMFTNSENKRREIREYAFARYSWSSIADQTRQVYENVLQG
jgi:glycosyltransferase involved in cell wall biosynthesis